MLPVAATSPSQQGWRN